jgi:hypothetical protein
MNYRSTAMLPCPAANAVLVYAVTRRRGSTAVLADIRSTLKEELAETRALHRILRKQRGAINGIHQYIVPVSKGSSKRLS